MYVSFVCGEPNEHHYFQTLWLSWLDGRRHCQMSTTSGPEFDFTKVSKLWYQPPQPSLLASVLNKPDRYFAHRFFLWMPRHLFHINLVCPQEDCNGSLTNAGVHQKTRMVLDVDTFYIMAGEYLSCPKCSKKVYISIFTFLFGCMRFYHVTNPWWLTSSKLVS